MLTDFAAKIKTFLKKKFPHAFFVSADSRGTANRREYTLILALIALIAVERSEIRL